MCLAPLEAEACYSSLDIRLSIEAVVINSMTERVALRNASCDADDSRDVVMLDDRLTATLGCTYCGTQRRFNHHPYLPS